MSFFVVWNFSSCPGLLNQNLHFDKGPASTHRMSFKNKCCWALLRVPLHLFPLALMHTCPPRTRGAVPCPMPSSLLYSFLSLRRWGIILHLVRACPVGWKIFALEGKALWWNHWHLPVWMFGGRRGPQILCAWLLPRESWIHPQRPPQHYNAEATADLGRAFPAQSPGRPDFINVVVDEWKYLYSQGTCHRQPGLFSPRSFLSFVVFSWKTAGLGSNKRLFTELQL